MASARTRSVWQLATWACIAATAGCEGFIDAHFDDVIGESGSATSGSGGVGNSATSASGASTGQGGSCPAGFDECDGDPSTLCETNLNESAAFCGSCSTPCDGVCIDGGCVVPQTNGAFLWLRSDKGLTADASELRWSNQVSDNEAIASDPPEADTSTVPAIETSAKTFNGHSFVRFDGKDDRIQLPNVEETFEQGFTAAFALRALATASPDTYDGFLFLGEEAAGDTNTNAIAIGRELGWDRLRFTVQTTYSPVEYWNGIVQSAGGIASLAPKTEVVVFVQRPDNASVWFYSNGRTVTKDWGDALLPANSIRDANWLGRVPGGTFRGDIAEVLLYNRAVGEAERKVLETYLAKKYGAELAAPCATDCPQVLARDQALPTYLASYEDRIVWTNEEGGEVMTIADATAPAPTPEVLFGGGISSVHPRAPTVDGGYVYWGEEEWLLHRTSLLGGDAKINANGEARNVALSGDTAYSALMNSGVGAVSKTAWNQNVASPVGDMVQYIAVDATHVYWSSDLDGGMDAVFRAPRAQIELATRETVSSTVWPRQVVLDATHVYFSSTHDGVLGIHRVSKGTPPQPTTLVTPVAGGDVVALALGGGYVYYTDKNHGTVSRAPVTGGSSTVLADGQQGPVGIAVVGGYVIWANRDGTIVRMPTP